MLAGPSVRGYISLITFRFEGEDAVDVDLEDCH
jgi:hypothetical protein